MDRRAGGDATGSIIYVIGALAAIAVLVVPFVLWARAQGEATRTAGVVVEDVQRSQAEMLLRQAIVAAELHVAEHGSYEDLTPERVSALDPATTYNASPVAVPGQVSVRAATAASVLFATRTDDDRPYCAVASVEGSTFGETDPINAAGCL